MDTPRLIARDDLVAYLDRAAAGMVTIIANASLSRLSHLVKRLEGRGLVRREPDPSDGRFTNAILTDKGFQTLADAAP